MTEITLYQQNRFLYARKLPLHQMIQLKNCLFDALKGKIDSSQMDEEVAEAMNSKVCDLEDLLTIHYVNENRDLSKISPIPPRDYLILYDRQDFEPLLTALKEGDFELANILTPARYRLIGYQELKEEKRVEEQGQGWGGQYSIIMVPPGIYPVFTRNFAFDRERGCYQSHLRDSDGITTWLEGKCISSSDYKNEDLPHDKVYLGNPYTHSVAQDIWERKGSISLIPPFEVVKITSLREGKEDLDSYRIMDISLPTDLTVNPIKLRTEEDRFNNEWERKSLDEKISTVHRKGDKKAHLFNPQSRQER